MFLTQSSAAAGGVPLPRATLVLIALALLAPFAFYFATAKSFVSIWNSSETFAHGYAILPISLYLIWRRRANFALIPARPYWPALGLLALLGAGWLLARMGEVQVVMQYAFVAMLPVIVLALLGPALTRSLAFPLLFLLFAVPFGEVLVGPLIEFTADFTVWAVQATGIPVLRNGTRFELPTGSWSVVEACSGIRYLISSITLGCLYAYLNYRSLTRRLAFVALAVVVPIIANGLRAYMIVMIGHSSDMALATGVDHLIYGWVFFGIVMFLMFWIGSYWRQDTATPDLPPAAASKHGAPLPQLGKIALAAVAVAAVWPVFALVNDKANYNPAPVVLDQVGVNWARSTPFTEWEPDYAAPDARFAAVYQQAGASAPLALKILYYRNQRSGKALISSVNRMTKDKDPYHEVGSSMRQETINGQRFALREARLDGPAGPLLVWHWTWVGGRNTGNAYFGKLLQAGSKLMFQGDDGAALMLAVPAEQPEQARAALRAFLESQGAALEAALQRARSDQERNAT